MPTKPARKGGLLSCQRGNLSPFMMGLLMGMSVFSVLSLQWAKKELDAQQARNSERDRKNAEELAKAAEFSLLTETQSTYSSDINLNRIRGESQATGKTRGGEDVLVVERDAGAANFGARNDRVAITASDDTLFRSQVYRTGNAEELARIKSTENQGVVIFDTSAIRDRQVRTSVQNMEALAEHIYSFFAGNMRFPTGTEFDEISRQVNLRDVWGQPFTYTYNSEDSAVLTLTTPWNYTRSLNLSLNDGNNSAESGQNPETKTDAATETPTPDEPAEN